MIIPPMAGGGLREDCGIRKGMARRLQLTSGATVAEKLINVLTHFGPVAVPGDQLRGLYFAWVASGRDIMVEPHEFEPKWCVVRDIDGSVEVQDSYLVFAISKANLLAVGYPVLKHCDVFLGVVSVWKSFLIRTISGTVS